MGGGCGLKWGGVVGGGGGGVRKTCRAIFSPQNDSTREEFRISHSILTFEKREG